MADPETPPGSPLTDRQIRIWLGILVVAWGIQAIVTQSLLLREALVLMFGSEFAWSVILFAWLLGVAVGGVIGGWVAERLRRTDIGLVLVLLLLSLAACVELWIFRGARSWLGLEPGELLPLTKTAVAAILFVSPASALVGMAFPLACCVTRLTEPRAKARAETPDHPPSSDHLRKPHGHTPTSSPFNKGGKTGVHSVARGLLDLGSVYALESAGSLIGGAAFSFWAVEHLTPIQTALFCGMLTATASAGLLFAIGRRPYGAVCLAMLAGWVFLIAALAGEGLERRLVARRWRDVAPGYELMAQVESKHQNLAVGRRYELFTLYCDGQVTTNFPDPYEFFPLAHFWMCQHPSPRNVLILGGGAEGLLAEVLRHPVEHVDYVEPDPRLIELVEPFLTDTDRDALDDQRVGVHHTDARYFIKTETNRFDLVIARLPEPMSALRARLYTDEFYRELRRAMTPRSVLCLTAAATPGSLTEASAEYLASIRATLVHHFPRVTIGWGNPAHILAATEPGLILTDPAELADRYAQRGTHSDMFDPAWFDGATDWLDPAKLEQRASELDRASNVKISTDLHPIVYLQRLTLWERMTGGRTSRTIERLRSIGWPELISLLLALALATLLASYLRARFAGPRPESAVRTHRTPPQWLSQGAIVLSIGTTGFATMALSIIWLFAFQNLYGYVYQRIGWIIAVFMGGLVIGCGVISWRLKRLPETGHPEQPPGSAGSPPLPSHAGPSSTSPLTKGGKRGVNQHPWETSQAARYLWQRLIAVDVLLALLALAIPFILPLLGGMQTTPTALSLVEWSVTLMVALTGILGGAAFALAGRIQLEATARPGSAAGSIVGADHAGACLGALLSGLLLVPVFGTPATAFLLAGLKIVSAALLIVSPRYHTR